MIDLSGLQSGDSVLRGKGKTKCTVNKVKKIDAFSFLVILFNNVSHTQTSSRYSKTGENESGGVDIVEIIKNPKQWTDEDMKEAYAEGAASASGRTKSYYLQMYAGSWAIFSDWLNQYKANRNK